MVSTDELLFCGGNNGARCFTLNLNTFAIASKRQMFFDRQKHSLILYRNKVFALGGYSTAHGRCLSQCEVYDTFLDKWTPIRDMHHRRQSFGACLLQSEWPYQHHFHLRRPRRALLQLPHRVLPDRRGPLDPPEHPTRAPLLQLPLLQRLPPDHPDHRPQRAKPDPGTHFPRRQPARLRNRPQRPQELHRAPKRGDSRGGTVLL